MNSSAAGRPSRPLRRKGPQLGFKKSRNGCAKCRSRKVKCDELRPKCTNCTRQAAPCSYETQPSQTSIGYRSRSGSNRPQDVPLLNDPAISNHAHASREEDSTALDTSETRSRRLLELRLLHHFIHNTTHTLAGSTIPGVQHTWAVEVPILALTSDNLLHQVLSISALHLSHLNPDDPALTAAYRKYLALALRDYRATLSSLEPKDADAACFTAILILLDAFAALRHRLSVKQSENGKQKQLLKYEPPMQWLRMTAGALSLFTVAIDWIRNDKTAKIHSIINSGLSMYLNSAHISPESRVVSQDFDPPQVVYTALLSPESPPSFSPDLINEHSHELSDSETHTAYKIPLAHLSTIDSAIAAQEPLMTIARRVIMFPFIITPLFVQLIEEQRPRALVILAHYFALVARLKSIWWIGGTGKIEVEGIAKLLSEEWMGYMAGPLAAVRGLGDEGSNESEGRESQGENEGKGSV